MVFLVQLWSDEFLVPDPVVSSASNITKIASPLQYIFKNGSPRGFGGR